MHSTIASPSPHPAFTILYLLYKDTQKHTLHHQRESNILYKLCVTENITDKEAGGKGLRSDSVSPYYIHFSGLFLLQNSVR